MEAQEKSTVIIHDVLVIIFSFLTETDWVHCRTVCRQWRDTIFSLCKHDRAHDLIRERKFLSAVRMMMLPRKARAGVPLDIKKIMREACTIPHPGIIKMVMKQFGGQKFTDDMIGLVTFGEISLANLRAMTVLVQNGYSHSRINMQLAAEHNCTDLAQAIAARGNTGYYDPLIAIQSAARYGNLEIAKIAATTIKTSTTSFQINYFVFESILSKSAEIAALLTDYIPDSDTPAVYEQLSGGVYREPYRGQMIAAITDRAMAVKAEREKKAKREKALEEVLNMVKSAITRSLTKKFGEEKIKIKFRLSRNDVMSIDWKFPWGFSYEVEGHSKQQIDQVIAAMGITVPDGELLGRTITVTRIYNTKTPLPPEGTISGCAQQ